MIRAQSFGPLAGQTAGYAAAAAASAADALASETNSGVSATDAATAQTLTEAIASGATSSVVVTDDWPGYPGPALILLDATLGLAFSSLITYDRLDAIEATPHLSPILDDWPGYRANGAWIVDDVGAVQAAPANAYGVGTPVAIRSDVTKSFAPANLATRLQVWGCEGQSLAIQGGVYTPGLITTTALHPGKVLMPSVGIWTFGYVWSAPRDAIDEYYRDIHTSQGSDPTAAAANITVQFWNGLYEKILADTGIAPLIGGYIEGLAGTSIQNLGPGTAPWEASIANMERYKAWADSQGYGSYMPGLRWIHGNEDLLTMSGEQYMAWLLTHQRLKTEAARRIFGQTEEVLYYIEQNTGAATGFAAAYSVVDAMRAICRLHPDKFRYLPPSYDLIHGDGIHLNPPNYYIREQRQAERVHADYYTGGRPPMQIIDAWWTSATTIRCEVYVPQQPLVLDTSGTIITTTGLDWSHGANGYGLEFDDGSGSSPYVLSSAIVNDGQPFTVTMTIASPCVVSHSAHGLADGTPCFLTTTGTLATGVGTTFAVFIKSPLTNSYNLSLTPGGAKINTSGSQSGVHTINVSRHTSWIDVTLSAAPSSLYRCRLLNAHRAAPAADQGPVAGARSCFRDSSVGTSPIDRAGAANVYPDYEWLARQSVTLPR